MKNIIYSGYLNFHGLLFSLIRANLDYSPFRIAEVVPLLEEIAAI